MVFLKKSSTSALVKIKLLQLFCEDSVAVYSSNTNISFFHSADEFEIVRQQRTQFALVFARISEEFLTSGFEFGKRFEVLVVQGFLLALPAREARSARRVVRGRRRRERLAEVAKGP